MQASCDLMGIGIVYCIALCSIFHVSLFHALHTMIQYPLMINVDVMN